MTLCDPQCVKKLFSVTVKEVAVMGKRATLEDWSKAQVLFEIGKSLNEIQNEVGIDRATISKRAKTEGWEKQKLQHLVVDSVRVQSEISTLTSTAKDIVENEIDDRLKHLEFFKRSTMKNLSTMMRKIDETITIQEHTQAQNALQKGKETILGKDIDTAIQINNTQQTAGDFKGLSDDELDTMHALLQKASA
jgi:uncharacterized protein YerC